MSKAVTKRTKKRAEPRALATGGDLLSAAPETQVPVPGENVTPAAAVDAAAVGREPAPEEEVRKNASPPAEALVASAPSSQEEMDQNTPSGKLFEGATEKAAANTAPSPQSDNPTAGALLKAAREAAGLSIDEISHSLKLAPRQVLALEQQDFAALPARAFVRGFMRNYARLLNIDADAVLAALPPEGPQTISPAASSVKTPTRAMPVLPSGNEKAIRPQTWKWLLAAAILALVAGAFFFWPQLAALIPERDAQTASQTTVPAVVEEVMPPAMQQEHNGSSTNGGSVITPVIVPLAETSAEPAVAPEAATSASTITTTAAENKVPELTLRFTADSWTEVRDSQGKVLYSALAKGGSEKTLQGEPPLSLVFGNSEGVAVTWRGESVDLGAQRKQGVRRFTLE